MSKHVAHRKQVDYALLDAIALAPTNLKRSGELLRETGIHPGLILDELLQMAAFLVALNGEPEQARGALRRYVQSRFTGPTE